MMKGLPDLDTTSLSDLFNFIILHRGGQCPFMVHQMLSDARFLEDCYQLKGMEDPDPRLFI